jgi:endonuclease/exonuclease/phosphatase family metal-dependent hydrolase
MNPLRPKQDQRPVEDSGNVSSHPDVREKANTVIFQSSTNHYATPPRPAPQVDHVYRSSPPSTPNGTLTKTRTVRYLSYSIFMRIPGLKSGNSDFKNARLNYFIDHVLPNYDVICLQEMYSYGSSRVSRLVQLAKNAGFAYSLTSPSKGLLNGCADGGLVILSRFELVKTGRLSFKRAVYNCRFVAKGALYAKVKLSRDACMHVFTTNLQRSAGQDVSMHSPEALVRQTQIAQLRTFIKSQTLDRRPTEPILVVGDFNLNALPASGVGSTEEYKQMLKLLRGEFTGLLNTKGLEDFLVSPKDCEPLPLVDLLVDRYGSHPITYGDVGEDGLPVETKLTDRNDLGARHSVDYAFWSPPLVKGGIDLDLSNRINLNPMQVRRNMEEFSHLSGTL